MGYDVRGKYFHELDVEHVLKQQLGEVDVHELMHGQHEEDLHDAQQEQDELVVQYYG